MHFGKGMGSNSAAHSARFHAEKVIVSKSENEQILNMYIVGCPRVHMDQIRSEEKSVLDNAFGITRTHIEA